MRIATLPAMFERALDFVTRNLSIERLLIQLGLDPGNVTYDAVLDRLLELAIASITFSNVFALIGGIFLVSTFVVRTIVPMRVLCIVSIVFFLGSAALAGSVPRFFLYLLALPINVVRLVQIKNLVKKARSSAQGNMSLSWLRPFMAPRTYRKGDVLFRKGEPAAEMILTESGKFLVTEIGIEIPAGRILGELGFLSPKNLRTQSVECIEDGEVLTIAYDKLLEIYFQNPEFGYYFLRLTSDRLLQNHARLEGLVEQHRAALAAAAATKTATKPATKPASPPDAKQAGDTAPKQTKPAAAVVVAIDNSRAIGAAAHRRQEASAPAPRAAAAGNVIELIPKQRAGPTAAAVEPPHRRRRALAIVERHANYSALGGFIPLPLVNVAAIMAVNMRMVRALGKLYGVPYERNRAYALVIGLMGGVMPTGLAKIATSTIAHFVPGYNLVGLAVSSVTASAYARNIGRLLIDHFESGAVSELEGLTLKRARR